MKVTPCPGMFPERGGGDDGAAGTTATLADTTGRGVSHKWDIRSLTRSMLIMALGLAEPCPWQQDTQCQGNVEAKAGLPLP